MTISTSRLSYSDCYDILEKAIANSLGVRVQVDTNDAAVYLRMRIHQARKIDREDNAVTYDEGHPLHGRSVYDKVVCRIREADEHVWLYVEQQVIDASRIEDLGEPLPQLEGPKPMPRIEYQPEVVEDERVVELAPSQFRRL